MDQITELNKKASSTKPNKQRKNNLKGKYSKKTHETVLNGNNIKIVKYKETDAEKLKQKYSMKKSDVHMPFDKELLDSLKTKNENSSPEVEEVVSPKVNVFQFMMNSRHKVIGSNSPGKEKKSEPEKLPEEITEKTEKLKKRKVKLEEWAEKKGGQKRKIADEAQEEYIKETMKKRAKRLKKMLEIIDEDLRNSSHDENDYEDTTKENENKIEINNEEVNKTPKIRSKRTKKSDSIEKIEETPKCRVTRSTENKSAKKEEINVKEENSDKTRKNVKKSIANLSLKKNKKSLSPEIKTNPELEPENAENNQKNEDDDNEDIFPINTPISNKKTRQLKLFQNSNNKNIDDENKVFSPKSWKMKVRLFEKENINENNDDDVQNVIIIDDKISPKKSQTQGKISNFFGSSTSSNKSTSTENKNVKLAPLFLKQQTKKQIKADIDAKKKFLYSGMPEQVKKISAKQQSSIEIEFDLFPKISHVQQRSSIDEFFWDLPNTSLLLIEKHIENINKHMFDTFTYGTLINCCDNKIKTLNKHVYSPPTTKLLNLKEYILTLKQEYPNFPVFKTFRLLYEKHVKHNSNTENDLTPKTPNAKKRRNRRTKKPKNLNNLEIVDSSQMWTEKYKPLCHDDIIGNYKTVKHLKCWLESWLHLSEDQKLLKRMKRANSSSDDFFNDSDTRDTNFMLPQNMVILVGPFGIGKTASVYALCNELNINVIEINASSKRTGKRILTELLEATQSHQVKNTDSKSVNSFFQKKTETIEKKDEENKKLSLLLMEDVDIVFDDQDDGFISSLTTLISSSKRPIILTTSDKNCLHLQKLFSQHDIIDFTSISCRIATPWLQILCLVEGIRVDKIMIERLFEWNKGDLRKTILQLQFWVQSGGDSNIIKLQHKLKLTKDTLNKHEEFGINDESSNLSWFESETSKTEVTAEKIHESCVDCFMPFYEKDKTSFQLSFPINLGNIWWNIPSILNIKSIEHKEIFKMTETSNNEKETLNQSDIDCSQNATKFMSDAEVSSELFIENNRRLPDLQTTIDFLESLVLTDTMYVKLKMDFDFEPTYQFWQTNPVNSLLLTENYEMYNETNNLSLEITQWLVEENIKKCEKSEDSIFDVNVAFPDFDEKRWRIKIHKSMEEVTNIIPPSCILDRICICEDYFPLIRTICRSENIRFANNNKRKCRFYHYFKTFNIHLSDATHLILCNSLAI